MFFSHNKSAEVALRSVNEHIRASTLLHISNPIGRPMQCHIRFLMTWRRESKERERGRCLAKQPNETTVS
jgi:hypothetical protein